MVHVLVPEKGYGSKKGSQKGCPFVNLFDRVRLRRRGKRA